MKIKILTCLAVFAVQPLFAQIEKTYVPENIFPERVASRLASHLRPEYFSRYLTAELRGSELQTKLPPRVIEINVTDDPLLKKGYLNLKWYAKGDGMTDDTEAIMDALYDAYYHQLALYIPPGTYLVSDTLECCVNRNGKKPDGTEKAIYHRGYGFTIIGDPANRPVIKLKDNAAAFSNPAKPKPVLEIYASAYAEWWKDNQYPRWENNCINIYTGGVSSLIIDCGQGNPGAVGLRFPGCQCTYAENIKILAHGAYAGFKDLPGNAGHTANLEVYGGRYGIVHTTYAGPGSGNCVSGCTLIDQTEAAIRNEDFHSPLTIVGFKIQKKNGPVFQLVNAKPSIGNGGSLALIDGTVELQEKSPCFVNTFNENNIRGRDLYLRNVYAKNADPLIESYGHKPIPSQGGEWSHIKEYAYASIKSVIVIDGSESTEEVVSIDGATPDDPMNRHLLSPREIPRGFDADAVSLKDESVMGEMVAKGDGVADDTKAFRYAIGKFSKVFVPKGTFRITGNLELKPNTVLFGAGENLSAIWVDIASWESGRATSVISSPDDPKATCMLSQLRFMTFINGTTFKGNLPPEITWEKVWPLVDWKAGKDSVVKNISLSPGNWSDPFIGPNGPLVRISGNGGGRWYGFEGGNNYFGMKRTPEKYTHLQVEGTRSPLVMYSLCVIYGVMDYYMEARDSQNIELYGASQETHPAAAGWMKFQGCSNVGIFGYYASCTHKDNPSKLTDFYFENCRDVTVAPAVSDKLYKNGGYKFKVRDGDTESFFVPIQTNCAYFRIGGKPAVP